MPECGAAKMFLASFRGTFSSIGTQDCFSITARTRFQSHDVEEEPPPPTNIPNIVVSMLNLCLVLFANAAKFSLVGRSDIL